MKTLDSIITDLQNTANTLGYEGPIVTALIYLLANAVYNNEITSVNAVLEASPSTCININSSIKHAYDNFYSVYRGNNQKFNLTNIRPLQSFSVHKYDQLVRVGNYGLYYAQDYTFRSGVTPSNGVNVILASKMVDGTLALDDSVTHFSISDADISEDIALWRGSGITGTEMEISNLFTDFTSNKVNFLAITSTDYGVDIFSASPIIADDIYYYRYLPYTTGTVSLSSIKSIPRFEILASNGATSVLGTSKAPESRLSDISQIFFNTMTVAKSGLVIRSAEDINSLITTYFHGNITGVNSEITSDAINVYYTTSLLNNTVPIDNTEVEEFVNEISTAYYITQNFNFVYATPIASDKSIQLKINYSRKIDSGVITNVYTKFQYRVGGTFNVYELIAELTSSISTIKYIDVLNPSTSVITVDLGTNGYIAAKLEITYNAVTITS